MRPDMLTREVDAVKRLHAARDTAHERLREAERRHTQLEEEFRAAWNKLAPAQQLVYCGECGALPDREIPPPAPPKNQP